MLIQAHLLYLFQTVYKLNVPCDDQERRKIIMKLADLIDENAEELAALDTIDAGKLFDFGKTVDIPGAAETLRYYAGAADKIHGETLKMSRELQAYTLREPIGVVGHIVPWNFPSQMFAMKVGPALAAGCTMVVKPAEQTPLSALYYAHLCKLVSLNINLIKAEQILVKKQLKSSSSKLSCYFLKNVRLSNRLEFQME